MQSQGIPPAVRGQFAKKDEIDGVTKLWRDVAAQVVLDACGLGDGNKARARNEALAWFRDPTLAEHRVELFEDAGLDPHPIIRAFS